MYHTTKPIGPGTSSTVPPNEVHTRAVGKKNPIELPLLDISKVTDLGKEINSGDVGTIHKVKKSSPPRVYKIIPLKKFTNGNEIRISKIAGDLGIAPAFHRSFLINQASETFVAIEMDNAGKSLGQLMEDFFEKPTTAVEEEPIVSEQERQIREFLKSLAAEDQFIATDVEVNKVPMESAIDRIYENPEIFYNQLFSKIKTLAENNIAYLDTHVGNIMPHYGTEKDLQLIDFDGAKLTTDTQSAVKMVLNSSYNRPLFNNFTAIKTLSEESKDLVRWFINPLISEPKTPTIEPKTASIEEKAQNSSHRKRSPEPTAPVSQTKRSKLENSSI